MLTVDLYRLDRTGRLTIEEDLPPDFPLWTGDDVHMRGPIEVRLDAQRVGGDVLVRGHLRGTVDLQCRRCLEPVVHDLDEQLTLLFRPGIDRVEAEREEVYPLDEGERELDLTDAVREHLLLAIPEFVVCRAECRGLCPRCGVNRNVGSCTCEEQDTEQRWGPLRGLKLD